VKSHPWIRHFLYILFIYVGVTLQPFNSFVSLSHSVITLVYSSLIYLVITFLIKTKKKNIPEVLSFISILIFLTFLYLGMQLFGFLGSMLSATSVIFLLPAAFISHLVWKIFFQFFCQNVDKLSCRELYFSLFHITIPLYMILSLLLSFFPLFAYKVIKLFVNRF